MSAKNARGKRRCQAKISYVEERKAAASAKQLGIDWYRCRFCGAWHTGHTPRKTLHAILARNEAQLRAKGL